jgi:predicted secreted Zn-dependent protease
MSFNGIIYYMDLDGIISQAVRLVEEGRRDEALLLLRGALQQVPHSARLWKWLAYYTRDPNEARRAVGQVLQLTPGDEWAQQAWRHLNQRKPQRRISGVAWAMFGLVIALFAAIVAVEVVLRRNLDMAHDTSGQIVVNNVSAMTAPREAVTVSTSEEYYTITGDSVESIRRALDENGPYIPEQNQRVIATTSYEITVNWSAVESEGVCVTEAVAVDLSILYTYPYLDIPSTAPPEIPPTWSAFMRRVIAHEEQHGAIASQCAYDVANAIGELPPQPDCAALEAVVNQTMVAQHQLCEARQAQFDADVGGESFP